MGDLLRVGDLLHDTTVTGVDLAPQERGTPRRAASVDDHGNVHLWRWNHTGWAPLDDQTARLEATT